MGVKEFLKRSVLTAIRAIFEKSISFDQFINLFGFFGLNIMN
jgi:hypothetical protein